MRRNHHSCRGRPCPARSAPGCDDSPPQRFRARRKGARLRLDLEALEDRVAPAWDLTISTAPTINIEPNQPAGTFIAAGPNANIAVSDLRNALLSGNSIFISDGTSGTQAGTITWQADAALDYNGIGIGPSLTVAVDPSAANGAIVFAGRIFDSIPGPSDLLTEVQFDATGDLSVTGTITGGSTTGIELSADVNPDGSGDDGVGTLTLGAGATISTGATVDLRGAAITVDTSNNPASVTAGAVVLQSSLETQPMSVGGAANAVAGINLTPAELARLSTGHLFVGDLGQLGDITLANLAFAGITASQNLNGGGKIVLDDSGGTAPALTAGGGGVSIVAGTGGILAASASNTTPEIDCTGATTLFSDGVIGSLGNRIQFASGDNVTVALDHPTDGSQALAIYLDGLGDLSVPFALQGTTVDVTARGNLDVNALLVGGGVGTVSLAADVNADGTGDDGAGTLTLGAGANVIGGNVVLRGAAIVLDTSSNPATVSTTFGDVSILSSVETRPISVGGSNPGTGAGINLSNPELACINAAGRLNIGDATQTGDITFVTALHAGPVMASEAIDSNARIVLDDGGGSAPALATGSGSVFLQAGFGGVVAASASNATAELATTGGVTIATDGPVGTAANRIQFADGDQVTIPGIARLFGATSSDYLDGLGNLTLGDLTGATIDVTARGNLTVPALAIVQTSANPISLAADVRPDGTGDDGTGTLTIATGATVIGGTVTLRGADISLGVTANPLATASAAILAATIIVRTSVPSLPMSIGGSDNAVTGVNLTALELNDLQSSGIIIGDSSQTGDITLTNAVFTVPVTVIQSADGSGQIILNDSGFGQGLTAPVVSLAAGLGGIVEVDTEAFTVGVVTTSGPLNLSAGGAVGSLAQPLTVQAAQLGTGTVGDNVYLSDSIDLNTAGTLTAEAIYLWLAGDFTAQSGALAADSINLFFTGGGQGGNQGAPGNVVQHLDSGGQAFTNLIHSGAGTLQLGAPLVVTGNLGNTDGNFAANDQPVQVGGVTTVNGNAYTAGAGAQAFAGGLVVDTNFSAAAGTVSAGGVTVGPDAVLVAPSSTLFDSGDWTNLGGIFDAHRGTVVLDGTHQHLSGSTLFNHLAKTAATTDTLTFQAGSTQTIAGNLILQGAAGSPLLLRSSATGTPWNVDPQGSRAVSFVDVEDSTNTAPTPIVAAGAHDSGDNIGWSFAASVLTWTGATSTDWNTAGNWDLGFVPKTNDRVIVAAAANEPILAGTTAVAGLTIQPGASLTLAGHDFADAGTFTNQGTLILDGTENVHVTQDTSEGTWQYVGDNHGSAATLNPAGYFNLVLADNDPSDTFTASAAVNVAGNFTLRGGMYNAGSQTTTVLGTTTISGGTYLAGTAAQDLGGGLTISGGSFTGSAGTVTASGVAVTGGVLTAPLTTLNDTGDWTVAGGVFQANGGTVTLTGTNQHVNGSAAFFNFAKTVGMADTLTFQAGSTQTVAGTLTLEGAAGKPLALRSSSGTAWSINPEANRAIAFVDVQNSTNASAIPIVAASSHDSGGNTGWTFLAHNLTWTGAASSAWGTAANWDQGYVPNAGDNVTIPAASVIGNNPDGHAPMLDIDAAMNNLTLGAGATLTLAGHGLTVAGSFANGSLAGGATLILDGNEHVSLAHGNDLLHGTWQFVGDGTGAPISIANLSTTQFNNVVFGNLPGAAGVFQLVTRLIVFGTLTIQSGNSLALAGNQFILGGTLVNQGTMILQGNELVTLAHGNDTKEGTWEYVGDDSGKAMTLGGSYFNLVIDDAHAKANVFQPSATLTINGALTVTAGTLNANTKMIDVTGLTTVSGGTYLTSTQPQLLSGGLLVNGGSLSGSTGSVTAGGVAIHGGSITAPAILNDSGNWTVTGGGFLARSGTTVYLTGTHQTIAGATTFFNLTKIDQHTADTLTFAAGSSQTVNGKLTLQGASATNRLALVSTQPGTPWLIQLGSAASQAISFVDVRDSDNTGRVALTATGSRNSGGNTNWTFS